jgi:5-formyltetrahydrofolate cyclo-ligase
VSVDVDAVSVGVRHHLDRWLPPGAIVLTYLAMPGEVDPGPPPGDRTVLVTRTPAAGPLTIHRIGAPRERHRFGFEQPVAGADRWTGPIDVVLLPGLAFGRDGSRLGRGTAYFDRLLADRDIGVRVGVAPAARVVDRLPTESHDVAVTHLATETGVVAVDPIA